MASNVETEILSAERSRCAAMLAGDSEALGALLDDRMHFCHATGAVDDKPTFLAKMASGSIRYVSIEWSEEQVSELANDVALLTGRMNTDVEVEGTVKQLRNRVITVWSRSDGGWQLLAFQSTPLKD